jgi:hypothetical protein
MSSIGSITVAETKPDRATVARTMKAVKENFAIEEEVRESEDNDE